MGFYTVLRWFFRQINLEEYCKSVRETFFFASALACDIEGQVISSLEKNGALCLDGEEDLILFFKVIKA